MLQIRALIILTITIALAGCASKPVKKYKATKKPYKRYHQLHDTAPKQSQVPSDLLHIPDADPKDEPTSKYGNPTSYVVFNKRYHVLKSSVGYKSKGLASWYGTKFHGFRTSSGEPYDMYAMTAAHKTLPLPTYVEVKNLDNGKKVIVKVNDRGPFHGDRIIDLSYAAAAKLDILKKGTGRIEVTAINPKNLPRQRLLAKNHRQRQYAKPIQRHQAGRPTPNKTLALATAPKQSLPAALPVYRYLQVGAFSNKANAQALRQKILQLSGPNLAVNVHAFSANAANSVFRVRIGPIRDASILHNLKTKIIQAKLPTPIALP